MKRLLTLAVAAFALHAAAAEFNTVQADKSQVAFVSKQMGVPVDGRFGKFAASIAFDPAKPEASRAQIDIDVASIDAGSAEANDEVKGKGWFDSRQFPSARFVSTGLRALGGGRYEAKGQMTIKGRTRDVVVPFGYRQDGANAVLEGAIPIQRLQYGIGEGVWSDTATVADEVQVKFRFTVAAGRK
jgi:polyisoprenoid-binding protein YceI